MGRRLNTVIHIWHEGYIHSFGPGDVDLPDWVNITNPDVWDEDVPEAEQPEESTEPPRHGAGSGQEHWLEYAKSLGLEVTEDMKRDEIIHLVDNQ